MDRLEAQENLTRAVTAAYQAGLRPFEVQDAIADGAHDAGQLVEASVAKDRALFEQAGLVEQELAGGFQDDEDDEDDE